MSSRGHNQFIEMEDKSRKFKTPGLGNKNQSLYMQDEKEEIKTNRTPGGQSDTQYWHRGELKELVNNIFETLEDSEKIVVEQKIELLEVLTGCETPNRYHVYVHNSPNYLFKCKEVSSWGCRNCCPSNSRAFTLNVEHTRRTVNDAKNKKKIIAQFKRDFVCTCCCCSRPKLVGTYQNEIDDINFYNIGTVIEKFSCGPKIEVLSAEGKPKWLIQGDCSQCGFFCRFFSLGKCYEVEFDIYDIEKGPYKKGDIPVGHIQKVFKGISELITDADAFILTFPKHAHAAERMMLIGAVLMIDYRYYEEMALCNLSGIL